MSAEIKPGSIVKSAAAVDRLPVGTVICYRHPVYQQPIAAVRVAIHDGTPLWEVTGSPILETTKRLRGSVRNAPVTVLAVPEVSP